MIVRRMLMVLFLGSSQLLLSQSDSIATTTNIKYQFFLEGSLGNGREDYGGSFNRNSNSSPIRVSLINGVELKNKLFLGLEVASYTRMVASAKPGIATGLVGRVNLKPTRFSPFVHVSSGMVWHRKYELEGVSSFYVNPGLGVNYRFYKNYKAYFLLSYYVQDYEVQYTDEIGTAISQETKFWQSILLTLGVSL